MHKIRSISTEHILLLLQQLYSRKEDTTSSPAPADHHLLWDLLVQIDAARTASLALSFTSEPTPWSIKSHGLRVLEEDRLLLHHRNTDHRNIGIRVGIDRCMVCQRPDSDTWVEGCGHGYHHGCIGGVRNGSGCWICQGYEIPHTEEIDDRREENRDLKERRKAELRKECWDAQVAGEESGARVTYSIPILFTLSVC
jgi:hypothetical protein